MAVLLKTASVRVSFIQIMQVRVQNKGKSVWKSRYDGDVSLDYASEDIDVMDDDDGDEQGQDPPFTGCWTTTSTDDVYMVGHPKRMTAMAGRIQLRTSLLRHLQSVDVNGAAQNHVAEKTAIPAPETITLRRTPKTPKPPSNKHPNIMIATRGKLTPMIRLGTRTWSIVIIYRSPRMM